MTVYADGSAIGSAVAAAASTLVTTSGLLELADGSDELLDFLARQAVVGHRLRASHADD